MASRAQSGVGTQMDVGRRIATAMNRRILNVSGGFALAPDDRLTDREMAALGDRLQALLAAAAEGLLLHAGGAGPGGAYHAAAPARFLVDRRLAAFLLCRLHPSEGDVPLARALAGESDGAIAAAARDFVEGAMSADPLPDMPRSLRENIVWTIAARMRGEWIAGGATLARADAALGQAGRRFLAALDAREGVERRAELLAAALGTSGRLDAAFLERCAGGGSERLLAAGLARLCNLRIGEARILLAGEAQGAALLLRGAGLGRDEAIAILNARAGSHPLYGSGTNLLIQNADAFDALTESDARDALSFWRTDALYRELAAGERQA